MIINSRAVSDVKRSWINHFCWHSAKCKLRHTESFHSKFWFHLNTHSSSPAGLLLLGSPQPQLVYSGTSPLSDQTKLPLTQLFYLIWQDKTIYLLLKCHSIRSSRCSWGQETCQCTSLPLQWKTRQAGRHWPGKTTIMHDIFVFLFSSEIWAVSTIYYKPPVPRTKSSSLETRGTILPRHGTRHLVPTHREMREQRVRYWVQSCWELTHYSASAVHNITSFSILFISCM